MLEAGKSYKIVLPNSMRKEINFHVDYIQDSVVEEKSDKTKLIVGRRWLKHRRRWEVLIFEAWILQMYNEEKEFLKIYKY